VRGCANSCKARISFLKKEEKNFHVFRYALANLRDSDQKFFGSFFQKRTSFFLALLLGRLAG
jgi:hypothetical protein